VAETEDDGVVVLGREERDKYRRVKTPILAEQTKELTMHRMTAMLFICLAGCQQQSSAPLEESSQETPTPKEQTEGVRSVEEQLENLGATIGMNEEGEIIEVSLSRTQTTDAGLVQLEQLTSLETLELSGTQISDAGMVHLEGLTSLSYLDLYNTEISDTGLVHLEGLTNLTKLWLNSTRISDAGLVHLEGLTNLQDLVLYDTQTTDEGVARLKKTLIRCEIRR